MDAQQWSGFCHLGISFLRAPPPWTGPGDYTRAPMHRFRFTLYVAGETVRSSQAAENLERLAREPLAGDAQITVVDVTTDPGKAEAERILTTPTVVKEAPEPQRRVTGDLGNLALVAQALGINGRHTPGSD